MAQQGKFQVALCHKRVKLCSGLREGKTVMTTVVLSLQPGSDWWKTHKGGVLILFFFLCVYLVKIREEIRQMDFKNQSFGLLGLSEGVIDCWQENWHPHPFHCCQEVLHGPERTWEVAQCPVRAPAPNGHTRKAPRRVGAKPKHCFWRTKEGLFVP